MQVDVDDTNAVFVCRCKQQSFWKAFSILRRRTVIPAPSYTPNQHITLKLLLSRLTAQICQLVLSAILSVLLGRKSFSWKTDFNQLYHLINVVNEPSSSKHTAAICKPKPPFPHPLPHHSPQYLIKTSSPIPSTPLRWSFGLHVLTQIDWPLLIRLSAFPTV